MKLPKHWGDITVGKYQQLIAASKSDDTIENEITMLSILSGVSEDKIEAIPIDQFKSLVRQTSFVATLPNSDKVPNRIQINGKKHSISLAINDLTGGQYIDLMTMTKDADKIIPRLHEILAIFIHPMERKLFIWRQVEYSGLKHRETADLIRKHLTMDIAYPIALFFCKLYESSMAGIQDYFVSQSHQELNKAKIVLIKELKKKAASSISGDG